MECITACSRKISSLKDSASARVAMNLCHDIGFKEIALRLEKPTYGAFIQDHSISTSIDDPYCGFWKCCPSLKGVPRQFQSLMVRINYPPLPIFVTDPEILSKWSQSSLHNPSLCDLEISCDLIDEREVEQWDAAVDKQCQRLTEGMCPTLKQGVQAWLNRIALEYLSYSRRQEMLFGMSRYFLMDVLPLECWIKAGRLDEKMLAERLLKDDRLTVLQRYRIACVYCLHVHIPQLWNGLTKQEKQSLIPELVDIKSFQQSRNPDLFWTDAFGEILPQTKYQWSKAAMLVMRNGSRVARISFSKSLEERNQRNIVIDLALQFHQIWQFNHLKTYTDWKKALILNRMYRTRFTRSFECFNLPSYYSELMCFYLSQMDEEQQLTFFRQVFQRDYSNCILECYLDWPHQDDFIPTISRLWGIIPKYMFVQCLLTLASKYTESCCKEGLASLDKEIRYYDYRSMLQTLWEETPDDYKRYLYRDENNHGFHSGNEVRMLLLQLLKRSPLEEEDEVLFKQIFCYQTLEKRKALMCSFTGKTIYAVLSRKEKWYFFNCLLEECVPEEEISSFKRQFYLSKWGRRLSLNK
ncbi:uncharacterized protein NPIL_596201 [Nephila pilipes]|uniref:Uncharacterized protein n=1 Tax=Nephila pilipes TaxID=299642 RepID=A0A8X6IQ69_NEPPI|nr:uncharacterized protein NPIL_514841 [Nephila pilipes]GFT32919.1 uncharacterized protein NPIL_596201 [Nephila pilipes]